MAGIKSLKMQYNSNRAGYISVDPLSRRENGYLPLSDLHELSLVGPYEAKILASVYKLVTERKGSIRTLTVPPALEQEDPRMWESLKSLVPNFQVRSLSDFNKHIRLMCCESSVRSFLYPMTRSSNALYHKCEPSEPN